MTAIILAQGSVFWQWEVVTAKVHHVWEKLWSAEP